MDYRKWKSDFNWKIWITIVKAFKGALNETKNYEGCQYVGACSDDKDKSIFLYEVWDSEDHQKKYIKWREDTGVLKTIVEMCREKPVFRFVDFLF